MQTCNSCGTVYPNFMETCLTCDGRLPETAFQKAVRGMANLAQDLKKNSEGNLFGFMTRRLIGNEESLEKTAVNLREQIRRECRSFYDRYAAKIGSQYARQQLKETLESDFTEDFHPSGLARVGEDLISTLHSLTGLREEYEEKQQELREQQEEEARQLRERTEREDEERRQKRHRPVNPEDLDFS